jgi:ubiquinone biosynthesis protein
VFYTQVFRDNFFHADAHAGNIWVDRSGARANPRFIALDFGIMGQLSEAISTTSPRLHGDLQPRLPPHRRTARAGRLDAGHVRIDELEAVRAVCEPYFTRPLSEISLAEVLVKLFRTAQRTS